MIMSSKLFLLVVISLFVFSTLVLGVDFQVNVDRPTQAFAGSHDFVKVTVVNEGSSRWFTVSEFGPVEVNGWFSNKDITYKIEAGKEREFLFEIYIPKDMKSANYGYSFIIKSGDERIEKKVSTEVLERTFSGVISDSRLSCTRCKSGVGVYATVKNVGSAKLDDVDLIIEVDDQKKKIAVGELDSDDSLEREVSFTMDKTKPGNYIVDIQLYIDGKLSDHESETFTIPTYMDLGMDKEITNTPIGAFVTLKAINNGNSVDKAIFEDVVEESWWISYLGPAPDKKDVNGWTWFATLLPQEEGEVSYFVLYWPVPILGLLLAGGATAGYLHLTGVHIKKDFHKMGDDVKISLSVKNLGGSLGGCVIRDIVPNSFILPKDFGTLKPIIRKTAHGTELLWRVGNMRSGEERVVNYNIIPRNLHRQSLVLPAASVKGVKNEKTIISVSGQSDRISFGKDEKKLRLTVAE